MGVPAERFKNLSHPDQLICSICKGVLEDPMQCDNEHLFCKVCIMTKIGVDGKCPVDGKPLTVGQLSRAPKIFRSILDQLLIKCDFAEDGCEVTSKWSELPSHLEECLFNKSRTVSVQTDIDGQQLEGQSDLITKLMAENAELIQKLAKQDNLEQQMDCDSHDNKCGSKSVLIHSSCQFDELIELVEDLKYPGDYGLIKELDNDTLRLKNKKLRTKLRALTDSTAIKNGESAEVDTSNKKDLEKLKTTISNLESELKSERTASSRLRHQRDDADADCRKLRSEANIAIKKRDAAERKCKVLENRINRLNSDRRRDSRVSRSPEPRSRSRSTDSPRRLLQVTPMSAEQLIVERLVKDNVISQQLADIMALVGVQRFYGNLDSRSRDTEVSKVAQQFTNCVRHLKSGDKVLMVVESAFLSACLAENETFAHLVVSSHVGIALVERSFEYLIKSDRIQVADEDPDYGRFTIEEMGSSKFAPFDLVITKDDKVAGAIKFQQVAPGGKVINVSNGEVIYQS